MSLIVDFGDSNAAGSVGPSWVPPLATAVGRTRSQRSASGHQAGDLGYDAYGYSYSTIPSYYGAYTPAADSIGIFAIGTNNQRYYGTDATKRANFGCAHLAAILSHALPSKVTCRSGGATFTGTWGDTTVNPIGKFTDAVGAEASASVSGTAAYVQFLFQDSAAAVTTHEIYVDNVLKDTVTVSAVGLSTPNGRTWWPGAFRVATGSPGSHIIRVKRITPSSPFERAYVDWIAGSDQAVKPRTIVCTIPRQKPAAYTGAPGFMGSDAIIAAYNAQTAGQVSSLSGDGLPIELCDFETLIDTATDLVDDTHFNSNGVSKIVSSLTGIINGPPPLYTFDPANVYARKTGGVLDGTYWVGIGAAQKQIVTT